MKIRCPRVNPLVFWRSILTVITPLVLTAIPLSGSEENHDALWCMYTILVMAVYWIFECLPLPITSLLPLVLLPLSGAASTAEVSLNYLNSTNMMFVASLIMSIAVEHCGFHRRLSLHIISAIGTSGKLIMLGFMSCTMFLSMWISNTAATALMVPIVDSVCEAMFETDDVELGHKDTTKPKQRTKVQEVKRNLMLLSCAYAANIGGTGVITGTPPNLVVLSTLDKDYGSKGGKHPMSYASWMAFCVPLMLVNTVIAWLMIIVIERLTLGKEDQSEENQDKIKKVIATKKRELGVMSQHEWQVVLLFLTLILLWFFQSPKFMQGWADLDVFNGLTQRDPPTKVRLSSATSAVFIVALAFMLPREFSLERSSPALLDWGTVEKRLPWGVILLLGGGFALADATGKTGLSDYIVLQLEGLKSLDPLLVSFIIAFVSTFLTEVASNTACANILVPILSQVLKHYMWDLLILLGLQMSLSLCSNPLVLMMTCAVCVSYAFMLPVATAPNAIIYSASSLKTSEMMRAGFFMNIICILTTWPVLAIIVTSSN